MFVVLISLIFALQNISVISGQQNSTIGTSCNSKDGLLGICKRLDDCIWAKKLHSNQNQMKYSREVELCGNIGGEEIVCCKRSAELGCGVSKKIAKRFAATETSTRYLGGEFADESEFPHQAALGYYDSFERKYKYNCAGSLISRNFVLTSAHCVHKRSNLPTIVKLGTVQLPKDDDPEHLDVLGQSLKIKNIKLHPDYSYKSHYNDIALIELESPAVPSKDVYPACLFTSPRDFSAAEVLYATGWGVFTMKSRQTSEYLIKGALRYVTLDECDYLYGGHVNKRLHKGIIRGQICAVDRKDVEVKVSGCKGDGG